jgi:hypothetical protein
VEAAETAEDVVATVVVVAAETVVDAATAEMAEAAQIAARVVRVSALATSSQSKNWLDRKGRHVRVAALSRLASVRMAA